MTQQYTPAQLEAWAGLGPWEAGRPDMATIVDGVSSKWIYSGNTYVAVASGRASEDWDVIMNNARLIAAAPDLARLVLEKEKEIAELKFEAGMKDKAIRLALKRLKELTDQTGTGALFASDIALIRQVMKETSDE